MQKDRSYKAFIAITVVWLFYLFSYMARIEPGVLVNKLMVDFEITSSVVGTVISVMYIPYILMQVPCGIITDKLGVKKIVIWSTLLISLGMVIFASATTVFQLRVARFIIGVASATAFISCGKVAAEYFDKNKYSLLMGIATGMGTLGGMCGTSPTAYFVAQFGWRNTTYFLSIIGLVIVTLAFFFMKNNTKPEKTDEKNNAKSLLVGLKVLVTNPRVWILGFYGAISYLPLSAIAELWGVPFVEMRYDVNTESASLLSICILIGSGVGSVLAPYVADKINSYKKTIIFFTIGLIFTFGTAIYSDSISFYSCLFLMFLGGICGGADILAFGIVFHLVPKEFAATSIGFLNALIMAGGVVFQPLLGHLLDFFRAGAVNADGSPLYNVGMYRSAFVIVVVCMVLGFIASFFINEVKPKEEKAQN